nr:DNA-3-methyladenine glycosylase 2 family protein [Aureimonas sp. ME7]
MIRTEADVERGLARLRAIDPRMEAVCLVAGEVPLRAGQPGFAGLAATVVAQQVSRASADAIFARLALAVDLAEPAAVLAAPPETFRRVGLSAAKERTLLALARAIGDGSLNLARIERAEPDDAIAELVALPGIGRWTAECYLLFALGHPDIFPAGDLALRVAVGHALGVPARPSEREVVRIAAAWRPVRSLAARLLWRYYHAITRRDAAPAGGVAPLAGGDTNS